MLQLLSLTSFLFLVRTASAQSYCTATSVQAQHLSIVKTINERLAADGFPAVTLVSELSHLAARKLGSPNWPPNTNSTCGLNPNWGWTEPFSCCGTDVCSYCFERVLMHLYDKTDKFSLISMTQIPYARKDIYIASGAQLNEDGTEKRADDNYGNYTYVGVATFRQVLVEVYSRNVSADYTACPTEATRTTDLEQESFEVTLDELDDELHDNSLGTSQPFIVVQNKQYVYPNLFKANLLINDKPVTVERFERWAQEEEVDFCEASSSNQGAKIVTGLIIIAVMMMFE